jgi:hypothetical protein
MKPITIPTRISTVLAATATGVTLFGAAAQAAESAASASWKDGLITPVANPIYFEDPRITSEVRPIFIQQWLADTVDFKQAQDVPLGGEVRVYALQLRYALTEKLALIATKDGYIEFKPEGALAGAHGYGWADLAAGLKYALVDDAESQMMLTPGFTITLPSGSHKVLQGDGSGEWNLFVSGAKGWNDLHLMGNLGFRIPNNWNQQTVQAHYSLQLDYRTCNWFIPFVCMNGYTVLTEGGDQLAGLDYSTEMYDLINYGSTDAQGRSQVLLGFGFRSDLAKNISAGVAYDACVTGPKGIYDDRLTVDMILRF